MVTKRQLARIEDLLTDANKEDYPAVFIKKDDKYIADLGDEKVEMTQGEIEDYSRQFDIDIPVLYRGENNGQ